MLEGQGKNDHGVSVVSVLKNHRRFVGRNAPTNETWNKRSEDAFLSSSLHPHFAEKDAPFSVMSLLSKRS
jgi:hypothetical protein